MAVSVTCPGCANTTNVSEELLGKKIRCKRCQEMFVAMGVRVPAGGKAPDERIQTRAPGGSRLPANGKARPAQASAKAAPAAAKSNGTKFAVMGGIAALVVVAGVSAWAVFGRGGDEPKPAPAPNNTASHAGKIKLNENTPATTDVADKPVEKPKATETATAKEPDKPSSKPASFIPSPTNLPVQIDPVTMSRVKKSSAWIKVKTPDSGGTGSGWFAEPGIVITNSHVVGMKEPTQPPPVFIKVVLDVGLPTMRTFDAKLLGLDRENDLAILQIEGDNLPPPMKVARSSDVVEGQRLYTVGFPHPDSILEIAKGIFGEENADVTHTVKFRPTHVAGRFAYSNGSVKYLQTQGGSDGGNSGGMIVDTSGVVRCMVVAGFGQDEIDLVIPIEYAIYLLQGRILSLIPAQAYEADGKVRQEFTAMVADPMKRIKRVELEIWTGLPTDKMRPPSDTAPAPSAGDSPRVTVEMAYDPNKVVPIGEAIDAKATWDVIPLPEGKVYWVQPKYIAPDGSERWGDAVQLPMAGIPVQRKPATLALKHTAGTERLVELDSQLGMGAAGGGELHLHSKHVRYQLKEKTNAVQPDGSAKMQFAYEKLQLSDAEDDRTMRLMYNGMLDYAPLMTTDYLLTKRGQIRSPQMGMKKIPAAARPFVEDFNLQTLQSLEALALALPDREVQPGETWKNDSNLTIRYSRELTENGMFNVTYRYMGRRVREGREEAVVEFEGKVARGVGEAPPKLPDAVDPSAKGKSKEKGPPRSRGLHGNVRGAAIVDLETGAVTLARSESELEFRVESGGQELKFGGALRTELKREVAPGVLKWRSDRLLPNQVLLMNPFVGAPNAVASATP